MDSASDQDPGRPPRQRTVRRRAVAHGVAWSVPVLVASAHAPAVAASAAIASVDLRCHGSRSNGAVAVVRVATLAVGTQVAITVSHAGAGGYTASPGFTPTTTIDNPDGSTTYVVSGGGAPFSGQLDLTLVLGRNATGIVTVGVVGLSGVTLSGVLAGTVTIRREGNSNNYVCTPTPA